MPDGRGLPDWRSLTAGTKVRVALWLASEVGEGGTFRMQDLRAAMPGIEQVDRRMRDLRPAGWVLETYRENPRLRSDELRLLRIGDAVWEPTYRSRRRTVPNRLRLQVMERDGFRCVRCGAGAGETYPDDESQRARLTVRAIGVLPRDGSWTAGDLVTECRRCSDAGRSGHTLPVTAARVRAAISELADPDKALLLEWLGNDTKDLSRAVSAYLACWQLNASERAAIARDLHAILEPE